MNLDLLLTSGTVYDGSGDDPVRADIGVSGDEIAAIGDLGDAGATEIIDCTGLAVSPGFIDIHTHSDLSLLANYRAESKIRQGVTTECTGQCGLGVHPVRPDRREALQDVCSFISTAAVEWTWTSTAAYIQAVREARPSVNTAPMVAHTPLRAYVVGFDNSPATETELIEMCDLARTSLDEGAVGISFGLAYALGNVATLEEVQALCRIAAEADRHVSVHIRNEGPQLLEALGEMIAIARSLGDDGLMLRLQIDHTKAAGPRNWHLMGPALQAVSDAHDEGLDISFDVYPYDVASRHLVGSFPSWMHAGGNEALLERLADEDIRERFRQDLRDWQAGGDVHHPLEFSMDRIMVVDVESHENERLIGKTLDEIAAERGGHPLDAVFDFIIEEDAHINVALFSQDESNVEKCLGHPLAMIGSDGFALAPYGELSRGRPHPRSYGTYPRFLGRYARDRKLMPLAEAINRCTARPATRLKLQDRGRLAEGMKADITVFDPDTIIDRATYTDPHQYPLGVEHVIVNGVHTVADGEHTDAGAGRVLG